MELGRHAEGVKTWRYGVLEKYCRYVDVEIRRYGALELWRRAAKLRA